MWKNMWKSSHYEVCICIHNKEYLQRSPIHWRCIDFLLCCEQYFTFTFRLLMFCISHIVNKSHKKMKTDEKKMKTDDERILLTSIVCVVQFRYSSFLWAIELHCCPETIKNTSIYQWATVLHWRTCSFI